MGKVSSQRHFLRAKRPIARYVKSMRTNPNQVDDLLNKLTAKPPLIQRVEERLANDDRLGINIGIQEGMLLKSLCSQSHVEKVVEIGTQYGCSAAWMALGLGEGGKIWTFEKDSQCLENARLTFSDPDFVQLNCQVQILEGPAIEMLPSISDQGPFDLIFIDANKSGYLDYWKWAKSHIKVGGVIVADNVFLFGSMFADECPEDTPKKMWNVMKETLTEAFIDPAFHSSLIPTEEGLLLATRVDA